jgi:translation initiation factor eIF-2B subunit epsilon
VIGKNCVIGSGTELQEAYLFNNVIVGNDCVIEGSIVGDNVVIHDGCTIPKGCLIADGTIIGPNTQLQPFERLFAKPVRDRQRNDDDDDSSSDESIESDVDAVEESKFNNLFMGGHISDPMLLVQKDIHKDLGDGSNALVWPSGPLDPDEEEEVEVWKNERFMRLGI